MTAIISPNVDRISLDERVAQLEKKAGPGGGGGGSIGMGGIPDFDQYPDNSFSEVPDGLIYKQSFQNLGTDVGLTDLPGVGFKLIVYWRPISGMSAVLISLFARAHLTQYITGPITQSTSRKKNYQLNNVDLWHRQYTMRDNYQSPNNKNLIFSAGWNLLAIDGDGTTAHGTGSYNSLGMLAMNLYDTGEMNFSTSVILQNFHPTGPGSEGYIFGSTSTWMDLSGDIRKFGAIFDGSKSAIGSIHGAFPVGPWISVTQLADLPAKASKIYPQSWCV